MKNTIILLMFTLIFFGCSSNSESDSNNSTNIPLGPTNLSGIVLPGNQIKLTWTDNSNDETGFKIFRTIGGMEPYSVIATVNSNITTYTDTGLNPNLAYKYVIYSFNSNGDSNGMTNEVRLTTGTTVTDIDGNNYPIVTIGNQIWTKSNLNVSRYRNGDIIPQVTNATQFRNLTTGAWCYYNNETSNGPIYGKLYNFYAVYDQRGLAPEGYHISNLGDWSRLFYYIDPSYSGISGPSPTGAPMLIEQGILHWNSPNTSSTNSTGFTALPGGKRQDLGVFGGLGGGAAFWTNTPNGSLYAYEITFGNNSNFVRYSYWANQYHGLSVRCLKND